MLPHGNSRLGPRRIPLSVGKRWEVCFLLGGVGCRKKAILAVPHHLERDQEYLRTNHWRQCECYSTRNCRRHGQALRGVWPDMGSIRINLRARTNVDWGGCQKIHNWCYLIWEGTIPNWSEGEVSGKNRRGYIRICLEERESHSGPRKDQLSRKPWGHGQRWSWKRSTPGCRGHIQED